jgi:BON domain
MNRNRLTILLALAAALALSACGARAEKAGGDGAASAPRNDTRSPAPPADGGPDAATTNASADARPAAPAPEAAPQSSSRAGGTRAPNSAPPVAMPTPEIGSGGNDLFLLTRARAAINADPELKAANLTLDVKEGVVTLGGTVASAALKSKAEQLVRGVGSGTVRNQLRVSAGGN